ncbi:isochorismatase family protein [Xanthomonas arboricola pv. juglandis]|uniref:Isochorismatase family protein n=1 Tax=Xanthomonas campestris pv. juglandis TaxID=195709 RepID=A0A2N7UYX7_XANCJ|nr:isochorismatase family protein [Xanthomonas arboricola]AKU48375.1 isochorismatase [Xanthomonas arboricola pv. juglandis]KOB00863.1 isochorismatase [Xanthomonas arboricola]KOB03715.1 isochorismatase [Xanthomonas arboricola]KOB06609.1 isochorismatase [Xanthomonas arboricola]KOB10712.1 isochorismatase [Xanthomonas arboricola]
MKQQRFTAENTALLLIDHQVGTMQLIKNIDTTLAAKQSIALAKMAKILNLPTIITSSQEDNAQGPILPEIAEILPEAHQARVKRPGVVNAWAYPEFRDAVIATGRKNLIMAGVTTDVCLIFPSIDAALEGFAVQAVMDASGSPSDLSEELSRQRMHDAGVVLTTTNTLMAEIAQDWSTPNGQQLIGLLFSDVFPAMGAGIA